MAARRGRSAAYCKPFSAYGEADADHAFASGALADGLDIAVGPAPHPIRVPLDVGFIDLLSSEAEVIIVEAGEGPPRPNWQWLSTRGCWKSTPTPPTLGVPLGRAGSQRRAAYRTGDVAESAADVAAVVVPESRAMLAPTAARFANHLDAVWTMEPVNADVPTERFPHWGNITGNGPTYYGRYDNQAVITRPQSPGIKLASMLSPTRCLVFTGLGDPDEYVNAKAMQRDLTPLQGSGSIIETADAEILDAWLTLPLLGRRYLWSRG